MSEPRVWLTGLGIPESPRWHEGRLWFCNWTIRQVVAVDMDRRREVASAACPVHPMGYSIDWLPEGRLLVTGDKVRRQESDWTMAVHADQHANEIVVDTRGNVYVNGADSTSREVRRPGPATSSSSPWTARSARSPATSSSPTAW